MSDWPRIPDGAVAIGWATVELDRAARELALRLARELGPRLDAAVAFERVPGSDILGARCRSGRIEVDGVALTLVLLEPSTEGRLAAFLARSGEGWAATWSRSAAAAPGNHPGHDPAARGTPREGAWLPGPFGPERLVPPASRAGPFRLVVSTATIDP